jgi:hypothetical protein
MTTTKITLRFQSSDGSKWNRRYTTLSGASQAAVKQIGATPTFGSDYAASDDGVCVVRVSGASLSELVPALEPLPVEDIAVVEAPVVVSEVEDLGAVRETAPRKGVRPGTKAADLLAFLIATPGSFDEVNEAVVQAGKFPSASEARDWCRYVLRQAGTQQGDNCYVIPGRPEPITITKKSGGRRQVKLA